VQDGYESGGPPAGAILWDFSTGRPRYTACGSYGKRVPGTLTCPEGTFTYPYDVLPWWFNTGDPGANTTRYREADPNPTLTGSSTGTWTASITWSWSLSPRY
jgi:hypothetical protein